MKLRLERRYRCSNYCIDKLYVNNEYFSDALEDPDRGLTDSMSLEEIQKIKIKGNTCIPYGTYNITLDVVTTVLISYIQIMSISQMLLKTLIEVYLIL